MLTLAARHADIIGPQRGQRRVTCPDPLADRVALVGLCRRTIRASELQPRHHRGSDRRLGNSGSELTRAYEPGKTDDELLTMPSVLSGSPRHVADTLLERRDRYGISYFTVQDYHGEYFAEVINALS